MNADVAAILSFLLEDDPVRRERAAYVARLRKHKVPFSRIGKSLHVSRQRAHQLSKALMRESDESDDISPKEMATVLPPDAAIQRISELLNSRGYTGEFKLWPKGTYRGPYPEYAKNAAFSLTFSGVASDFWTEDFNLQDELQLTARNLGYHGEAASQSSMHFYQEVPWDESDLEPAPEPKEPLPAPNLRDIQF